MLIDISKEERKIIVDRLKEYLGVHGRDLSDKEKNEIISMIEKIEAIRA